MRRMIQELEKINAAAEADMLAGNPITGAHHRAIEQRLAELRAAADTCHTQDCSQVAVHFFAAGGVAVCHDCFLRLHELIADHER